MNFFWKYLFREILSRKLYSLQIIISIAMGVGAISGVSSYKVNLKNAIFTEAKVLMGADLTIQSSRKFEEKEQKLVQDIIPSGTELAMLVNFSSMLYNEKTEDTALSMVRAIEKKFPFYGSIVTRPQNAYVELGEDEILLDENLAKNLKLELGDKIQLGSHYFFLKGFILREPGLSGSFMGMAPGSIILDSSLPKTGLSVRGSRIQYNLLVKLPPSIDSMKFKEKNFEKFIEHNLTLYHNTEAGSGSQKFINNTLDYLSLLAMAAFFLGAIAIYISCKSRLELHLKEIAVLKCIGADSAFLLSHFISELLILSTVGVSFGILTAYYFQFWIPDLAGSEFLLKIKPSIPLTAFLKGVFTGILLPLFVALESILNLNRLSPLLAIRKLEDENPGKEVKSLSKKSLQLILLYTIFFLLSYLETEDLKKSFALSISLVLIPVMVFLSYLLLRFSSRFVLSLQFFTRPFRLTLKKLYTGKNHLNLPVVGIGSALSILILSIFLKDALIRLGGGGEEALEKRPNVFVLDIKKEQKDFFSGLLKQYKAENVLMAPMIGARLYSINGEPIEKTKTEKSALKRDWKSTAKTREYFLSYRESLYDTESLEEGKFWEGRGEEISVEKDFAKSLGVKIGDSLQFNVQGKLIEGRISNLRSVNWSDMKPNFVVLFSPGILQKAPAFYISSFLISEVELRYKFQKELVKLAPNITAIDIEKSVKSFLGILEKVTDVIRLMTLFIIVSSFLLLYTAIYSNRKTREEEIKLLRLIGAPADFIRQMYLSEGLLLGLFSFLSGLFLASISNYFLSTELLNLSAHYPLKPLLYQFILIQAFLFLLYFIEMETLLRKRTKKIYT
ncbi:MAG: FtsX-like permease family protein [Leptospiraceae bacterium]|nr:FtsX-like permease family protein [Leptospiraceae bacterium]